MHKINLTHTEKEEKRMKGFFHFFENFNRDFGTLGMEIAKIRLQIRTRRPRIRLYANFGQFGCIISLKNNQLACFFGHPVEMGIFMPVPDQFMWLEPTSLGSEIHQCQPVLGCPT